MSPFGEAEAATNGVIQAPALPGGQPISARDRASTADQTSNTVTVINPATNEVLGTLPIGNQRLDGLHGARNYSEANTHGPGFSPDGSQHDVINVATNSAVLVQTASNRVQDTFCVGRLTRRLRLPQRARIVGSSPRPEVGVSYPSSAARR